MTDRSSLLHIKARRNERNPKLAKISTEAKHGQTVSVYARNKNYDKFWPIGINIGQHETKRNPAKQFRFTKQINILKILFLRKETNTTKIGRKFLVPQQGSKTFSPWLGMYINM